MGPELLSAPLSQPKKGIPQGVHSPDNFPKTSHGPITATARGTIAHPADDGSLPTRGQGSNRVRKRVVSTLWKEACMLRKGFAFAALSLCTLAAFGASAQAQVTNPYELTLSGSASNGPDFDGVNAAAN